MSNKFSDFIRNATPEEKGEVYGRVMERATNRQRETMKTIPGVVLPLAVMAGAEWNILDATGARVAICASIEGNGWQGENAALARAIVDAVNTSLGVGKECST